MPYWRMSNRADPVARVLADRHYNRQKPGTPQFVPPGRCIVLRTRDGDAVWVTSWPYAQYVKHAWAGAWVNSLFRNEGPVLSSELIIEAVQVTSQWWTMPELGIVSFIDPRKVKSTNPGYCYQRAGWHRAGMTKGGLVAMQLLPEEKSSSASHDPRTGPRPSRL